MTEIAINRRKFYASAIYGLNAIMAAALAVPTLVYLLLPKNRRRKEAFVDAGDISQLTPGVPAEMSFQQSRVDGWRVVTEKRTAWVVKDAQNKVTAYGPQCTHLGCAYHWEHQPKQFVCPCHSSLFSIQGEVIAGPAQRPLDRYASRVANGRLLLGALRSRDNA
ncbi:MAG TPA: Rieske (2Fe-2S) protein [Bryobacteraceae bacterium]|nr:Rieske (2Fe-2S) protein [Bryobacteraceae bacterium]